VLEAVIDVLAWRIPQAGGRAALQGPQSAAAAWLDASGSVDLDIWADEVGYRVLAGLMQRMNAARVQHADDPARLRHTSWLVETTTGPAIVDVTVGDLRVGPVTLLSEASVTVSPRQVGDRVLPRLSGAAAAADLLVRPLLRGKVPPVERVAEARTAWAQTDVDDRALLLASVNRGLSRKACAGIASVLDGADVPASLLSDVRRAYIRASLRGIGAAWRQRHVIVPAGRRAGVAGVRARGVLVVLVGTDGSGKSTLAETVSTRLEALGIPTSHAYMGMARGNLPGVALARKVLGVPSPAEQAAEAIATASRDSESDEVEEGSTSLDHALLRRVAAWFYAIEYLVRYFRDIRPYRRVNGTPAVVISDRYVYDLQDSPWPGSRAATVARWLMPSPDVLLVPDAPDALIHARKPERPAREQAAQQAAFRALAAEQPARSASLLVDTSGHSVDSSDPVAPALAAIVEAMHLAPRDRARRQHT
jgi:hypothetical protein